jgi:type III restriction enzyme
MQMERQDLPALVKEVRRRLSLSQEGSVRELGVSFATVNRWENSHVKPSNLADDQTRKILRCYQRDIARFVHAQMQNHYWEEAVAYKVVVSKRFSELKESACSYSVEEPPVNYGVSPEDKSNMSRYLFGGFKRCLYGVQKCDSEAERKLAAILERDALKWFKPAKGQFQIIYRHGADHLEYIPDFVAETAANRGNAF